MHHFHMNVPDSRMGTLEGFVLDGEMALGQYKKRPAILVCPGGGYVYCAKSEGEPVAMGFAARGFHTFILRYSTGFEAAGFQPLKEVSWAIGYIRENAEKWNIDPEKIVVCGFSAGGHLALSSGLMAENKPNAMILGYPAASAPNFPGADFMLKLLTGKQTVTDEDAAKYDLVPQITKDAPPVFLVATAQDLLTGYGALPIAQKYCQLGLPYEIHVFGHGPHGYSVANETSCDGSSRYLNPAFAQWQGLCVEWIHKTFGPLTFEDKDNSKMMKYLKELGINLNM
ncbi:MAG: alpha/beta hydrolase [Oscillospiraceae bacterium]|nr:alpha/beta hydrolase [Oscillospiraceae bacterium]